MKLTRSTLGLIAGLLVFTTLEANADLKRGGISGGGGDLISPTAPTTPVAAADVIVEILESQRTLYRYLEFKESEFQTGSMPAEEAARFAAIFNLRRTVLPKVSKLELKIDAARPCFDNTHKAVDGSFHGVGKDSVCLSAFTIAQKSVPEEIPAQSAALLLHEFSEIQGATETEAIDLQVQMLNEPNSHNP